MSKTKYVELQEGQALIVMVGANRLLDARVGRGGGTVTMTIYDDRHNVVVNNLRAKKLAT